MPFPEVFIQTEQHFEWNLVFLFLLDNCYCAWRFFFSLFACFNFYNSKQQHYTEEALCVTNLQGFDGFMFQDKSHK